MCVSQTLFQETYLVTKFDDLFNLLFSRGTQEAHRAVSNEALYGVFRISGLITLTYLHWEKLLTSCYTALFPSITIRPKIPLPYHPFFDLCQYHFRIVLTWSEPSLPLVLYRDYSWPSINFHACFFQVWRYNGLWQAINSHFRHTYISKDCGNKVSRLRDLSSVVGKSRFSRPKLLGWFRCFFICSKVGISECAKETKWQSAAHLLDFMSQHLGIKNIGAGGRILLARENTLWRWMIEVLL